MISFIRGEVIQINYSDKLGSVEVLTSMGLGYEIFIVKRFLESLEVGKPVDIFTVMLVREDDQYLCGFQSRLEKGIFKLLTSVSGIGAKTAMSIINEYNVEQLMEIMKDSDAKRLSKVSGLGVKGAQKIILELTGKLDTALLREVKVARKNSYESVPVLIDLNEALFSLGYRGAELQKMTLVAEKKYNADNTLVVEQLIESLLRGE